MARDKLSNLYLRLAVHNVTIFRKLLVSPGSTDSLTPLSAWGQCSSRLLPIRGLEAGLLRRTF